MTEQVDLDALEALAKAATPGPWTHYETMQADNHVTAGGGILTGTHVCGPTYEKKNAAFIATADPSTVLALIAELRQERERANENADAARGQNDLNRELWAALSRAEETIEKVRNLPRHELNALVTAVDAHDIDTILTEYGKQKEADRG